MTLNNIAQDFCVVVILTGGLSMILSAFGVVREFDRGNTHWMRSVWGRNIGYAAMIMIAALCVLAILEGR